jgi:hypothetical protein
MALPAATSVGSPAAQSPSASSTTTAAASAGRTSAGAVTATGTATFAPAAAAAVGAVQAAGGNDVHDSNKAAVDLLTDGSLSPVVCSALQLEACPRLLGCAVRASWFAAAFGGVGQTGEVDADIVALCRYSSEPRGASRSCGAANARGRVRSCASRSGRSVSSTRLVDVESRSGQDRLLTKLHAENERLAARQWDPTFVDAVRAVVIQNGY